MKKTLISLLVVVMLVLALSVTAMAADLEEVTAANWTETVTGGTVYVQLTENINDSVTIPAGTTLYLDLNGHDITSVTNNGTLYLLDSQTDGYTAKDSEGNRTYGMITMTDDSNAPERAFVTTVVPYGHQYRYITIKEDSGYSAHRFYIGLTKVQLYPKTDSFYYQAAFVGDEVVVENVDAYGVSVDYNGTTARKTSSKTLNAYNAEADTSVWQNHYNVGLVNVLALTDDEGNDVTGGWEEATNSPVVANVFLAMKDEIGGEVTSSSADKSFADLVRIAQTQVDSMSDEEFAANQGSIQALTDMYQCVVDAGKREVLTSWNNEDVSILYHCLCGASVNGGEHKPDCNSAVLWRPWTGANLPNKSGYWYMKAGNEPKDGYGNGVFAAETVDVYIDLNGQTVNTAGRAFTFDTNATGRVQSLTIMDSVGTGSIVIPEIDQHSVLMNNNGGSNNPGKAIFNLYGGHLDASNATYAGSGTGAIRLRKNAVINMYGGKISGQSVDAGNTTSTGDGGAIYLDTDSNMTMSGSAEIVGGDVSRNGGAICAAANTTLTMSGNASITGGEAAGTGGNIHMEAGANVKLEGSASITDGIAKSNGGNINNNGGTVELTGTSFITGGTRAWNGTSGTTHNKSADVMILGGGKLVMSGGLLGYGHMNAGAKNSAEISGSAQIRGLEVQQGTHTIVAPLTENADIRVSSATAAGASVATISADANLNDAQKAIVARVVKGNHGINCVVNSDGTVIVLDGKVKHCVCGAARAEGENVDHEDGCNETVITWTAYPTSETSLSTGNYYLTQNMTGQTQKNIDGSKTVYIDLNGYNLESNDRAFGMAADGTTLWLLNSAPAFEGTGIVSGKGALSNGAPSNSGVIMLNRGTEFRLFKNVTVKLAEDYLENMPNGGAIRAQNSVKINMYGGKIIGCEIASNGQGGAVYLSGANEFNMYGGEIIGGKAGDGGAVYIRSGCSLTMSGNASITGGHANSNGGNVHVASGGELTVKGAARITGGSSSSSSSKDVFNNGGKVYMEGGEIGYINCNTAASEFHVKGNAKAAYIKLNVAGAYITIDEKLGAEARININSVNANSNGKIIAANSEMNAQDWLALVEDVDSITTSISKKTVQYMNDGIYVVDNADGAILCPFGCTTNNHNEVGCPWASHSGDNGQPLVLVNNAITESGHYYLTEDISSSEQIIIGGSGIDGSELDVILDLNGYNISSSGKRVLQIWNNAELTLLNTTKYEDMGSGERSENGGGVIDSTGTSLCDAYAVVQTVVNSGTYPNACPTVNMYDGVTLRNSDTTASYNCGGVLIRNNAVFNMYGGRVEGSKVESNAHSEGTGTCDCKNIEVKESGRGGAFYIQSGGTLNVYGGEIVGADVEDKGGAIYNAGTVNLQDAVITNGTAGACGGSIYNTGTLNLENVAITGANAGTDGGAIYNLGTLKINGATISGTAPDGGSIYTTKKLPLDGNISISGDVHLIGVKLELGENLAIQDSFNVKLFIREGAFSEGADAGSNIGKITLNGEATVVHNGNFYANNPTATSDKLLVGFGSHSVAPTQEQIRFSGEGYKDTYKDGKLSGYYALCLDGYSEYPAGKILATKSEISGYNVEYNELKAQAVAYADEQGDVILMVSVDATNVESMDAIKMAIWEETGVMTDNIMISATHAHSTPIARDKKDFYDEQGNKYTLTQGTYYETLRDGIVAACEAALQDLAEVSKVQTATVAHVNGASGSSDNTRYIFNSVRNFKAYDKNEPLGTYTPNHSEVRDSSRINRLVPESTVDDSVQLVKYERTGKNNLIIANFQTHPLLYGTGGNDDGVIHADGIGPFRGYLSENYSGADVIYFSGASGNVTSSAHYDQNSLILDGVGIKFPQDGIELCLKWGMELANVVRNNAQFLDATLNTDVGVARQAVVYNKMVDEEIAEINYTLAERRAMAQAIVNKKNADGVEPFTSSYSITYNGNTYTGDDLRLNWKIYSYYHAYNLIKRQENKSSDTGEVTLYAYAAGNIAFAAAPYEMFDANGMQIKTGNDSFDMTIVATKTGNEGYVPSQTGFDNGGYSTDISPYAEGTGEKFTFAFLDMLNGLR